MARRSRRNSKRTQFAHFEGLDDFLRDMNVLPAQIAQAERVFEAVAAATVVTTARQFAAMEGKQQVKAATTLRQAGPGVVQYGGLPFAMGAEFGSILYGQFPEWRGNKDDAGYFFYPAIRNFRDEDMLNLWVREVWTVVEGLFSN